MAVSSNKYVSANLSTICKKNVNLLISDHQLHCLSKIEHMAIRIPFVQSGRGGHIHSKNVNVAQMNTSDNKLFSDLHEAFSR